MWPCGSGSGPRGSCACANTPMKKHFSSASLQAWEMRREFERAAKSRYEHQVACVRRCAFFTAKVCCAAGEGSPLAH